MSSIGSALRPNLCKLLFAAASSRPNRSRRGVAPILAFGIRFIEVRLRTRTHRMTKRGLLKLKAAVVLNLAHMTSNSRHHAAFFVGS